VFCGDDNVVDANGRDARWQYGELGQIIMPNWNFSQSIIWVNALYPLKLTHSQPYSLEYHYDITYILNTIGQTFEFPNFFMIFHHVHASCQSAPFGPSRMGLLQCMIWSHSSLCSGVVMICCSLVIVIGRISLYGRKWEYIVKCCCWCDYGNTVEW